MDWGLLSMYIALILLGFGTFIYSKIEDKRHKGE